MEKAKAEVEKRVSKILKFIQNKNKIPKDSKRELLGLVKDLHEHCQSLYLVIEDCKDASAGETRSIKGKSHSVSSTSSSDMEYYSSEDIENNTSGFNQGIETLNSEVAGLKQKLEALNLDYVKALRNLQEAEVLNKSQRNEMNDKEREFSVWRKELERQLGDVKAELQAQYDLKGDMEEQISNKANEAKRMEERNIGMFSRISELEQVLKEKGDEVSNLLKKFGNNEKALSSRTEDLKIQVCNLQHEVDFLRAQNCELAGSMEGKRNEELDQFKSLMDQVNAAQHELASLRNQKNMLQSQLDRKSEEASQTQIQVKRLQEELARHAKVERMIKVEKEAFQTKANTLEQEVRSLRKERDKSDERLKGKILQTDGLREEKERLCTRIVNLDSAQPKKSQSESQIDGQKQSLVQMDDQMEDQKIVKRWSFGSTRDSKLNLNLLERKMEELAEDFRMKMEDHIRILFRRIHVAEQIHLESKNNFRKTRDTMQGAEAGENLALYETQFKKMKNMLEPGFAELDMATKKLDETGNFVSRVSQITNEIRSAKTWVSGKNTEAKQLKHEIEAMSARLECSKAQESLLKGKLSKLEAKLAEEGTEKLNLVKVLAKFETKVKELDVDVKTKTVELLSLGEEKKEAIRQLCALTDYQRSKYNDLKRLISKITVKP